MRRIVVTGAVVAFLLGLTGCGGGPELGMPKETTATKPFGDMDQKQVMDKMKEAMLKAKHKSATPGVPK